METKEWTFVDKTSWGEGPWQSEPDKRQWTDAATGLPCVARRGPGGHWCGYVGVPPGHRFHQTNYDEVDLSEPPHGGLTYADFCQEDHEHGVCHTPAPGEPDPVWWLGFDCAHSGDLSPKYARHFVRDRYDVYRDLAYVAAECRHLAAELSR